MLNPLLQNKQFFYYFLLLWFFLAVIQTFLLHFFYLVPLETAILDSVIFNIIFCLFAINLWYAVKFIDIETQTILTVLLNHLVIAVITISLWIFVSISIFKLFKEITANHKDFLNDSLPARFLIGLFLYSVVVLLYYSFNYYSNLQDKIRGEVELQALVKEAELNILKSQINPHFIFNSLNSISSLTLIRPEQARSMIIKLSEFLRYALDQDMKEKTKLKSELENIKRYLEIEKIRFGNRLQFEIKIDNECQEALLPNMILQPLLENAIKHGVHESLQPIYIEVNGLMEYGNLKICLKNNYDKEGVAKKRSGIGLQNIQNRLQLIYGRGDLFTIKNDGKTFEVFLTLPQPI